MENEEDNWDDVSNTSDNEEDAKETSNQKDIKGSNKKIAIPTNQQDKTLKNNHTPYYNSFKNKKHKANHYYDRNWNNNYYHDNHYEEHYYPSNNKQHYPKQYNKPIKTETEVEQTKKLSITLVPKERKMHVIKLKDNQTKILFSDQNHVQISS